MVGVLLAAGRSTRYGAANKLLADLDGRPVVARAAAALASADLDAVLAVVGFEHGRVRTALGDAVDDVLVNESWADGQGTSVAAGAEAARSRDADAVLFALGDMPWVGPEAVAALRDAYRGGLGDALAAAHEGRRGNPVLFDARHCDALAALDGTTGGAAVFADSEDAALVETGDPGVRRDVDRPSDLEPP